MKKKKRPALEVSISFLDVISCGFGAIVLLLLIAKTVDYRTQEEDQPISANIPSLQDQLFSLRRENRILSQELTQQEVQISREKIHIAHLNKQLEASRQQSAATDPKHKESEELNLALQILTEEMQRLLGPDHRRNNQVIGGIPVDSEYIVFIIDTSGSMFNYAWPRVRQEMINILDIYPEVKGIQILNDMGGYMFSSYRGKWIPDTPARRKAIINRLQTWTPFSNSSPVEGIQRAIRAFYASNKRISLYVLGDDFTGSSVAQVLDAVDRANHRESGRPLVRIHTIGFPVHFLAPGGRTQTANRFANLMREMSYRNGGTFVGLNSLN